MWVNPFTTLTLWYVCDQWTWNHRKLWVLLHLTSNQYVMQCMDDVDEIVPALWYSGGGMMPHFCSLEPFTQSPILSPPLLHKTCLLLSFRFVRTHFVLPISSKVFLLLILWKLRLMVTPLTTVSQVTLLVRKFRELNGQYSVCTPLIILQNMHFLHYGKKLCAWQDKWSRRML